MDVQLQPMPLATLVELVNGWGIEPRRAGARSYVPALADHVHRAGVPRAVAGQLTDDDLVTFAETIFPIFAADPAGRVAGVSDLLSTLSVRPDLAIEDGRVQASWFAGQGQALLAAAALALRQQLVDHDPARLGICVDGGCADIYIDASPGAHRRFCSVTCQNRARVAKFRRRQRAGS